MALASPLTAAMLLQFVGGLVSAAALLVIPGRFVADDMFRALVSGIGLGVGLSCYYTGLSRSTSTVVAPLVATLSAVVPFGYVVVTSGQGSTFGVAAAAVAFAGLALVSSGAAAVSNVGAGLRWGISSGLGYGVGIAVVTDVSADSGIWPAAGQRLSAFVLLAAVTAATKAPLTPPPAARRDVMLGGVFIASTTIALLIGIGFDAESAVVTLSLFPVFSVAVGWLLFSDSVRRIQLLGIAIALVGVAGVVAA
jgi:drug/metabolite transporter (DMT)-like permease